VARRPAPLRSRIVTHIGKLDAREWDSVVSAAGMRHEAAATMHEVRVKRDWVYALVRDEHGPYAVITGRPHRGSPFLRRALLEVTSHLGVLGGIQLRRGVELESALPRLVPTLARMARRRGCAGFSVLVPDIDAAIYAKHDFAFFEDAAVSATDLSGDASYDDLVKRLPDPRARRRARKKSEQHGLRFEVTSPPRGPTRELFALVAETFATHETPLSFTPDFFERIWSTRFAEHVLLCAYLGDKPIAACWAFHTGGVLVSAVAGLHYPIARPSHADLSIYDETLRFAMSRGIRRIEWGPTNCDIKQRYGGATQRVVGAVRPAYPLPGPIWRGLRAALRTDLGARIVGERELGDVARGGASASHLEETLSEGRP